MGLEMHDTRMVYGDWDFNEVQLVLRIKVYC